MANNDRRAVATARPLLGATRENIAAAAEVGVDEGTVYDNAQTVACSPIKGEIKVDRSADCATEHKMVAPV
jgi:hypothetical protein